MPLACPTGRKKAPPATWPGWVSPSGGIFRNILTISSVAAGAGAGARRAGAHPILACSAARAIPLWLLEHRPGLGADSVAPPSHEILADFRCAGLGATAWEGAEGASAAADAAAAPASCGAHLAPDADVGLLTFTSLL